MNMAQPDDGDSSCILKLLYLYFRMTLAFGAYTYRASYPFTSGQEVHEH